MNAELGRRAAFTLGALLVYRFGAYIPLPGTDVAAWSKITGYHSRDILFGLFDLPSAGTARHLAIFALGITPYITAAILIRIGCMAWSRLRNLGARRRARARQDRRLYALSHDHPHRFSGLRACARHRGRARRSCRSRAWCLS